MTMQEAGKWHMTGGERGGEGRKGEKMRKGSERMKGCNGFMQSRKRMSGVFWPSSGCIFWGENKCKRTEWEVAEEEPIYLNPVWVSSRPWTS